LPAGCGTQTLPWLVGEGWAKRMILTNERVDADTALRIGLVEEVVDTGVALAKAREMAAADPSLTQTEIAKQVGCTRENVTQAVRKTSQGDKQLTCPEWILSRTHQATFRKLSPADQERVRVGGRGSRSPQDLRYRRELIRHSRFDSLHSLPTLLLHALPQR